jgi:general stress protein 26
MDKQDVLAFIKTKKHTVISTYTPGESPESAVIGFGETDKFELIFGTYKTSRKYKNLKNNNKVAFVIGLGEEPVTVQYEGIATELKGEEIEKYVSFYYKKSPDAAQYQSHPEESYWKVEPKWIRYTDISGEEEVIVEFTF